MKLYAHGELTIKHLGMEKHRTYDLSPTGNSWVEDVSVNGEYVYITMAGESNEQFHLKFEGDSGIVIDRWSENCEEHLESFGCWDFYDDEGLV